MRTLLANYYDDLDQGRTDSLVARHTDGVVVKIGNAPSIVGKEALREGLVEFVASFKAVRHDFVNVFSDGDHAIIEVDVTYTRLDGASITVPAASFLGFREGLVDSLRVYIDMAPVFVDVVETGP